MGQKEGGYRVSAQGAGGQGRGQCRVHSAAQADNDTFGAGGLDGVPDKGL